MKIQIPFADGSLMVKSISVPNRYFAITPWLGLVGQKTYPRKTIFSVTHIATGYALHHPIRDLKLAEHIANEAIKVRLPWQAKKCKTIMKAFRLLPAKQKDRIRQLQAGKL